MATCTSSYEVVHKIIFDICSQDALSGLESISVQIEKEKKEELIEETKNLRYKVKIGA